MSLLSAITKYFKPQVDLLSFEDVKITKTNDCLVLGEYVDYKVAIKEPKEIRYIHIIKSNKKGTFGFTIAYVPLDSGKFKYAVAFCSPVERNFSRKMGREISTNRLTSNKECKFTGEFTKDKDATVKQHVLVELDCDITIINNWMGILVKDELNKENVRLYFYNFFMRDISSGDY